MDASASAMRKCVILIQLNVIHEQSCKSIAKNSVKREKKLCGLASLLRVHVVGVVGLALAGMGLIFLVAFEKRSQSDSGIPASCCSKDVSVNEFKVSSGRG